MDFVLVLWNKGWAGKLAVALLMWLVVSAAIVAFFALLYWIKVVFDLNVFWPGGWHDVKRCVAENLQLHDMTLWLQGKPLWP